MDFKQNFSHFFNQSDSVGQALFFLLMTMSVISWYLIFVKKLNSLITRRLTKKFLTYFWNAPSLKEIDRTLENHSEQEPFTHLTYHAINALYHHENKSNGRLEDTGSINDFLTRAIRRVIDEETARLEWGLTLLASIASTAPFVGLFGTVWGVYNALINVGKDGQVGLEQIASPVGEALIMTGFGLIVAVPAVLAYNDCVRQNRILLAQLDAFAHDLFALLITGAPISRFSLSNTTSWGNADGVR